MTQDDAQPDMPGEAGSPQPSDPFEPEAPAHVDPDPETVIGAYHQLSAKHLPAYLDEMAFRFNNRNNPYLFRDTVLRLVEGETLPYAELIET